MENLKKHVRLVEIVNLDGLASFAVASIGINGNTAPVTWTTATNWTVNVPLTAGTNHFAIVGCDVAGKPMADAQAVVTVVYTGPGLAVPLELFVSRRSENELVFTWSATPGRSYRLESKPDLSQVSWATVQETTATSSLASVTNLFDGQKRFYRLVEP